MLTSDKIAELTKKYVPKLLVILLIFCGGILLGWQIKPTEVKVEEKIKVVEVGKQVVVIEEKVRVEVVKVKDVQIVERYRREKTEEKKPDGTIITRETEDRNIDSVLKEKETAVEVKVVEVEKQVIVEKEKEVYKKIDPVLAQWHVGVLAGASIGTTNFPTNTNVLLGAEVERRIAGPFWAGVFVSGESPVSNFNVQDVNVGLKLAIEF